MAKKANITVEEWLAELEKLDKATQEEGFTVSELAKITGKRGQWIRVKIQQSKEEGQCAFVGKKRVMDISDRPCWKPAYKFIFDKKKKK